VSRARRNDAATKRPVPTAGGEYRVVVEKDYLKFSAAHFIAYKGFREPLHGHNYQVSVAISGTVGPDGYVLDFGIVKQITKAVCGELDERVLVPAKSDCLAVAHDAKRVMLTYEDGTRFVFPAADTVLLPIVHASAEELATYVLHRLRDGLEAHAVRGLKDIEVGVSEAPGQAAFCRERF
jgi:6-pyruvoyl-tetrahydropterin synthase